MKLIINADLVTKKKIDFFLWEQFFLAPTSHLQAEVGGPEIWNQIRNQWRN